MKDENKPHMYAFESEEIVKKVLGDLPNQIVAKSIANLGKVYLMKSDMAKRSLKTELAKVDLEKAETLMKAALDMIKSEWDEEDGPLFAKYN